MIIGNRSSKDSHSNWKGLDGFQECILNRRLTEIYLPTNASK